jgi:hypothetical protein
MPPETPRSRSFTRLTMRVGLPHLGQSVLLVVSITFLRSAVLAILAISSPSFFGVIFILAFGSRARGIQPGVVSAERIPAIEFSGLTELQGSRRVKTSMLNRHHHHHHHAHGATAGVWG